MQTSCQVGKRDFGAASWGVAQRKKPKVMNKREVRRLMEETARRRLEELRAAEREAEMRLVVLRTVIAEIEALLNPAPIISGDNVGEQEP